MAGLILAVAVVVGVAVAVTVAVVVAFVVGSGDFSNSYKVPNKNENFKLVFNKTCPSPK